LFENGSGQIKSLRTGCGLGQRLFARFGTIAILGGVLFVLVGWIGFLIWALI
jgi:hypothetical protein